MFGGFSFNYFSFCYPIQRPQPMASMRFGSNLFIHNSKKLFTHCQLFVHFKRFSFFISYVINMLVMKNPILSKDGIIEWLNAIGTKHFYLTSKRIIFHMVKIKSSYQHQYFNLFHVAPFPRFFGFVAFLL